jgi:hypothetical protein
VNNLFAWLLFGVALAWSFLVGLLAGVGTAVVARRSTDALNILVAVLFMFGGALVLSAKLVPGSYLILGIFGFGAGILLALALQSGAPIPLFRDEPEPEPEPKAGGRSEVEGATSGE